MPVTAYNLKTSHEVPRYVILTAFHSITDDGAFTSLDTRNVLVRAQGSDILREVTNPLEVLFCKLKSGVEVRDYGVAHDDFDDSKPKDVTPLFNAGPVGDLDTDLSSRKLREGLRVGFAKLKTLEA